MNTVKDIAVCIRTVKFSESSQIVTLFTRNHGKLPAIAKGARRPASRFDGGIGLLAAGAIIFTPAKQAGQLATLHEFVLTDGFEALREDLLALNCAQVAAQLVASFVEEIDPHEILYDALIESLNKWGTEKRPEWVLLEFELRLLQEIGLAPIWDRCTLCGRSLETQSVNAEEAGRLYFSSEKGGMLCAACEQTVMEKRFVQPNVLEILQNPQRGQTRQRRSVLDAHTLLSYHQRELLGSQSSLTAFVNGLLEKEIASL